MQPLHIRYDTQQNRPPFKQSEYSDASTRSCLTDALLNKVQSGQQVNIRGLQSDNFIVTRRGTTFAHEQYFDVDSKLSKFGLYPFRYRQLPEGSEEDAQKRSLDRRPEDWSYNVMKRHGNLKEDVEKHQHEYRTIDAESMNNFVDLLHESKVAQDAASRLSASDLETLISVEFKMKREEFGIFDSLYGLGLPLHLLLDTWESCGSHVGFKTQIGS